VETYRDNLCCNQIRDSQLLIPIMIINSIKSSSVKDAFLANNNQLIDIYLIDLTVYQN